MRWTTPISMKRAAGNGVRLDILVDPVGLKPTTINSARQWPLANPWKSDGLCRIIRVVGIDLSKSTQTLNYWYTSKLYVSALFPSLRRVSGASHPIPPDKPR